MKAIKLLLSVSPGGFAIATLVGILGGAAGTALLHGMTQGVRDASANLGVLFVVMIVAQVALAVASHGALSALGARLVGGLRMRIARAALATAFPQIERIGLPRIRTAIVEDAQIIGSVTGVMVSGIVSVVTLVGGFVYVAWLSPPAAIATVVLALLASRLYKKLAQRGMQGVRSAFAKRARLYEDFEGVILGATEVRLHEKRRAAVLADAEGASSDFHASMAKGVAFNYAAEAVGQTAIFIGVGAAIAALAAFGARYGGAGVILGVVYMQTPLFVLLTAGPQLTEANVVSNQLEQLLGTLGSAAEALPAPANGEKASFTSLELADVRFKYAQGQGQDGFDLGPIDLTLKPGEIVFLTGGNGSGKTTFAKVLVGLYTPEGRIALDGKALENDADRERYRSLFAVVYSDGFVFPELWGLEEANVDEKANALIKELQLSHKVEVKGGHLSSTRLSQGQKKRLALLAAYLEDRPIFLFDEWAADQDPEFKHLFYTKYLAEIRAAGKSAIVISHDDRYFDVADRVVRLERGQIQKGGSMMPAAVAG